MCYKKEKIDKKQNKIESTGLEETLPSLQISVMDVFK